jgi:hypothetical protein
VLDDESAEEATEEDAAIGGGLDAGNDVPPDASHEGVDSAPE